MKNLNTQSGSDSICYQKKPRFRQLGLSMRTFSVVVAMLFLICFTNCEKSIDLVQEKTVGTGKSKASTSADQTFHIALIPDTQYYTELSHGGTMTMFSRQIDFLLANRTNLNIQYVAHLGDITDDGDRPGYDVQWVRANQQFTRLHDTNFPYGLAVGNHDQWCPGDPGSGATASGYGKRFGRDRFMGTAPYYSTPQPKKPWYGTNYTTVGSNNNDNHYDFFTVFGQKYMVLFIEYNEPGSNTTVNYPPDCPNSSTVSPYSSSIEASVSNWANLAIQANSDAKVIIVSHSIMKPHTLPSDNGGPNDVHNNKHKIPVGQGPDNLPGKFTNQGQRIYDMIAKNNPNVFMMFGGHITGEGYRVDNHNGHIVKSFVSDYQFREKNGVQYGGDGWMRLLKFNLTQGTVSIRTIQPLPGSNNEEMDADSKFTVSMYN